MSGNPTTSTAPWGGVEADGGLEQGDAGPLRADERAGHVEALLGEERVQVVAGDAAGEAGEAPRISPA